MIELSTFLPGRNVLAAGALSVLALPGLTAQIPGVWTPETPVWGSWRGPDQTGVSREKGLPGAIAGLSAAHGLVWTVDLAGRGTPVVADGRIYAMAYRGEGPEARELLVAIDEQTGTVLWEHEFYAFLTDTIYYRLAIGSPVVDPETRQIYCMSNSGLLSCFSPAGEVLWQHTMGAEFGRLTFPNGRVGSPVIVEGRVILHTITSAWAKQGPARDRFFAFDKKTGETLWTCTPGGPPKDGSFSMPVVEVEPGTGRLLMYAGLGGGHMVCVDARTGAPVWKYQMSVGGVNSSALLYGPDTLIAIHGKENLDSSEIGRMVALDLRSGVPASGKQVVLPKASERWRNDLVAFTSSPVLVGDTVYQTVLTGELVAVDARTGNKLWHEKLAPSQVHASPAFGDGKLYVPMANGSFHVLQPTFSGCDRLSEIQLDGSCLGAPAIANGRVYVHTTGKLYAFEAVKPAPLGIAKMVAIRPADVVVREGEPVRFDLVGLDASGREVENLHGFLSLLADARDSVEPGPISTTLDNWTSSSPLLLSGVAPGSRTIRWQCSEAPGLSATARLRVVPQIPYTDGFDAEFRGDSLTARPRSWWIGAGKKWEIMSRDGENVLAKTIKNPLFQRTMSYIGHPDDRDYTIQVDILTDGNRRGKSSAGLVNQRYLVSLKGNHQELEVSSTVELLKVTKKFPWKSGAWYTLKVRVQHDAAADVTVVEVKCWPRDEAEPDEWTMSVEHPRGSAHGSPGIWGFVPQSRHRVYLDNLVVAPNR